MYYTIYKITNKLDGKFYIGMHKTNDLDDGYMGSGKLISRAIKKHGIENFTKDILHIFDNEQNMRDKEKELVVLNEMSYNLCEGGKGGFSYVNGQRLNNKTQTSQDSRNKKRESLQKFYSLQENRAILSDRMKKRHSIGDNPGNKKFKELLQDEAYRQKLSERYKQRKRIYREDGTWFWGTK